MPLRKTLATFNDQGLELQLATFPQEERRAIAYALAEVTRSARIVSACAVLALAGCGGATSYTAVSTGTQSLALSPNAMTAIVSRVNPRHAAYSAVLSGCDPNSNVGLDVEPHGAITGDPATFYVREVGEGSGTCSLLLTHAGLSEALPLSYSATDAEYLATVWPVIEAALLAETPTGNTGRATPMAEGYPRTRLYRDDGSGPITSDRIAFFDNYEKTYIYVVIDLIDNPYVGGMTAAIVQPSAGLCSVAPTRNAGRAMYTYFPPSGREWFFSMPVIQGIKITMTRFRLFFNQNFYPFDTSTCRIAFGQMPYSWPVFYGP